MDAIEEIRQTLAKENAAKDAYIKRLEDAMFPILNEWYEHMCDCERPMDTDALQLMNEMRVKQGMEPLPWAWL